MSDYIIVLVVFSVSITLVLVLLFIIGAVNNYSPVSDEVFFVLLLSVFTFIIVFLFLSFLPGGDDVNEDNVPTTISEDYYHESILVCGELIVWYEYSLFYCRICLIVRIINVIVLIILTIFCDCYLLC